MLPPNHPMNATLFISDSAAAIAAGKALRSQFNLEHATIHRRVQRDPDTRAILHGFVVKLIARNGGVSYV